MSEEVDIRLLSVTAAAKLLKVQWAVAFTPQPGTAFILARGIARMYSVPRDRN